MSLKITLPLVYSGPFSSNVPFVELAPEQIRCNNVVFAGEFNPHNVRLFVIGNEFGALGAVWADCEQDAFDELVDCDLGNGLLVDEATYSAMSDEEKEELSALGNAGEPADMTHAWIAQVDFQPARDWKLLIAFAEARGACADTLDR